jgi:hypothetical protein
LDVIFLYRLGKFDNINVADILEHHNIVEYCLFYPLHGALCDVIMDYILDFPGLSRYLEIFSYLVAETKD